MCEVQGTLKEIRAKVEAARRTKQLTAEDVERIIHTVSEETAATDTEQQSKKPSPSASAKTAPPCDKAGKCEPFEKKCVLIQPCFAGFCFKQAIVCEEK